MSVFKGKHEKKIKMFEPLIYLRKIHTHTLTAPALCFGSVFLGRESIQRRSKGVSVNSPELNATLMRCIQVMLLEQSCPINPAASYGTRS